MNSQFVIVGAGPAGLIAAQMISAAGHSVTVIERMPSAGRKFLMAGRGGLNLTHSEPLEAFKRRYACANLHPMLDAFTPEHLRAWASDLGQATFVGSSGRVFPEAMKASPLLRAWLTRLRSQGVTLRTRAHWTGWDAEGALTFINESQAAETITPAATLLALGGASWPKLGSDGGWRETLQARGIEVRPFVPSNVGFNAALSAHVRERFAGAPLKAIAVRFGDQVAYGDLILTDYGVEGGAFYALTPALRDGVKRGDATIYVDLRPSMSAEAIAAKLKVSRTSDTLASRLRKALALSPAAINLLRESGLPPREPSALAKLIKAAPIVLTSPRGIDRAISSAGGVAWSALDTTLQAEAAPRVYVAGEMLDWEAPTGGYLLQACFATGAWAARSMLAAHG